MSNIKNLQMKTNKLWSILMMLAIALSASISFSSCGSDDDEDIPGRGGQSSDANTSKAPKGAEAVDLGLSVKWANMNIGATTPEGFGDYFAWGETQPYYTAGHSQDNPCTSWNKGKETGYEWASYFDTKDGGKTFETYAIGKETQLKPEHDAACANWKGSWRMPTKAEIDELCSKCNWARTTLNGVEGYRVTGKNGKNSIFLPAAGNIGGKYFDHVGSEGEYWTSSLPSDMSKSAYELEIISGAKYNYGTRMCGRSVRAVCP